MAPPNGTDSLLLHNHRLNQTPDTMRFFPTVLGALVSRIVQGKL